MDIIFFSCESWDEVENFYRNFYRQHFRNFYQQHFKVVWFPRKNKIFWRCCMVRNLYSRNFRQQQNFDCRKVPIEKVRFAPRFDIIAQKLATVASGEVLWNSTWFPRVKCENHVLIFTKLRLRPQERAVDLWYRIESQNAPSRFELFENKMFVADRNFCHGNI